MHKAFEGLITGLNRSGVKAFLCRYPVTIAVLKNLQHEQTSVLAYFPYFIKPMTLRPGACTLEYIANQQAVLCFATMGRPKFAPVKSPVTSNNRLENCIEIYKGLIRTSSKIYVPSAADAK